MNIFSKQPYAIKLIVTGVLSFLFFLVISIPATLVTNPLQKNLPLNLSNVQGTIWSGQADELIVNGMPFGTFEWSMNVLPLLTGMLSADINLQGNNLTAQGDISVGFGSKLQINDMSVQVNLAWLMKLAMLPFALSGDINADIDHLHLTLPDADQEEQPLPMPNIQAMLIWKDAGADYPETVRLGDYKLEIKNKEKSKNIIVNLIDGAEALTAKGSIELESNGNYNMDLILTPVGGLASSVSNALSFVAKRKPNGEYALKQTGSVKEYMGFSED